MFDFYFVKKNYYKVVELYISKIVLGIYEISLSSLEYDVH